MLNQATLYNVEHQKSDLRELMNVGIALRQFIFSRWEEAGQLQPILKSGLRLAFRIMDCRDTRGYDVTLTDNQKRALVKRIADIYEKVGVAGLALGLFQYNFQGALIGLGFLAVSLLLTYLLER